MNPEKEEANERFKARQDAAKNLLNQPVSQVRRPTNAFMIFSKEMNSQIKAKQPEILQSEIMRQVG